MTGMTINASPQPQFPFQADASSTGFSSSADRRPLRRYKRSDAPCHERFAGTREAYRRTLVTPYPSVNTLPQRHRNKQARIAALYEQGNLLIVLLHHLA